jgi:hypothetical protein
MYIILKLFTPKEAMKLSIKTILKNLLPSKVIIILSGLIPDVYSVNIYLLKHKSLIKDLVKIDNKFLIRELNIKDTSSLKQFYPDARHILPRLGNPAWVGLAVIDSTNDSIAYVSWVIKANVRFINDFKIEMNRNQFMVIHGYCAPQYRHQGLHTRMEQERLNYCYNNGAKEVYVHIATRNLVGITTLINSGYKLLKKDTVIYIRSLGIYRRLNSFTLNPFRRGL